MNGCSKRRSHRVLYPVMDIYGTFPKMQRFQAEKIAACINRKTGSKNIVHPCINTWGKFVQCARRFGPTTSDRCIIEAQLHQRCLGSYQDWEPAENPEYMALLERFNLFNNSSGRKTTALAPLSRDARGTVCSWGSRSGLDAVWKDSQP
eukprot:GHVQ01008041.1.p1 GENE.GHVQ01008041.1~~GHVQ01008041.1.p1  ORF type:complete len:149 (+),score=11.04 GHVQ01008041.1:310-756(+)